MIQRSSMDTAFLLDEVSRAEFIRSVIQSFGCTYICLWSHLSSHNCLLFWDGTYHEQLSQQQQPSSSSGSSAQILFDKYCQSVFPVENFDCVPGLAFKNRSQYLELHEPELHRLSSNETQRQFYQEARIKTAVFMGSRTGEIELGMSHSRQINMEMEMRNLFPKEYFSAGSQSPATKDQLPPPPAATNRPSSSSSSLRSIDSPEYPPFVFNINPTTPQIIISGPSASLQPSLSLPVTTTSAPTTTSPLANELLRQALGQIGAADHRLPIKETDVDAEMTRAILAVLTSSPSSSSSSSHHPHQQQPQQRLLRRRPSAFKKYGSSLAPVGGSNTISPMTGGGSQSMLKRAMSFYIRLNNARRQHMTGGSRPSTTQLHHMISERRRREKLNESFQALRSLLPAGTKRDKASLLVSTRQYLSTLISQVAELSQRNQKLEAQLLPSSAAAKEAASAAEGQQQQQPPPPPRSAFAPSSDQRYEVHITPVAESTSEQGRIINLGVSVRGESGNTLDLVIRLLEFLKQVNDEVSLISMEANTRVVAESSSFNNVVFGLRIKRSEWDESGFQEAVERVVADLAQ